VHIKVLARKLSHHLTNLTTLHACNSIEITTATISNYGSSVIGSIHSLVLILGGIIATSWSIRKLSKPAPVAGAPVNTAVKIMVLFNFLVGILLLAIAAGVWLSQAWDSGTRYLLLVTSLALVLKPLKDIPWAALIGLV